MPVPAFFWQLSCAAAGLLVCVLPIAVPSLPWADDISSPISSAENPAQAEYDPAADYRVLSQELAQMGLEQEKIHLLWNRMGAALSQKLEAGELSPADISCLALPYGREDCGALCRLCAEPSGIGFGGGSAPGQYGPGPPLL